MGVFEKAVIFGEQMVELIPQRTPFVFVDAFFINKKSPQVNGVV